MASDVSTAEGYRLTSEKISNVTAAYLYLPNHPNTAGCVVKTVRLQNLLSYEGADIIFDMDTSGAIIGVEILSSQ